MNNILNFFRSAISLDSPIRVFYHFLRGVIADFVYGNPSKDMIIIGVTGTKGKTTTTNIIARGLQNAGHKVFMFSTVNVFIGDEEIDNNFKMTSPSPFLLQRLLKKAKEAGCKYAVIETSSHSIFYYRNYGINYDVAVLTNIYQDHLDLHKTMDNYARTKLRLFEKLISFQRKPNVKKVSIINIDSDYAQLFLDTTADNIYTFGLSLGGQIRADNIQYTQDFTEFDVVMPGNNFHIKTKLRGEFNIYNILAGVSVLVSQKVSVNNIKRCIEEINGIPGRLEDVYNNNGFKVFVDYAHTEDSLRSVLSTVRNIEGVNRIITIFGATGDRDKTKRPKMGKVVEKLSDVIILTDDDTYTENSISIINDVKAGISREEGDDFWIVPDRKDAIRTGLSLAKKGDVVLIAGKGAETAQITNKGAIPWNDKKITEKILFELEENEIIKR